MSKAPVIAVAISAIVISIITFALSCWEVRDEFKNTFFKDGGSCDDTAQPFRATYQDEFYVLQCGWTITRSAVRFLYLLLFFIILIPLYFISIFKKKSLLFLLTTIGIFVDGVFGFYSFVADGKASSNGNDYCKNLFYFDFPSGRVKADCKPNRFYGAVALSVLTVVLMFILGVLSFVKRSALFQGSKN